MKTRIDTAIANVREALRNYNFEDRYYYALWLSQAYYFVKHSTPLLALSAGLSAENNAYHNRCIDHLSEEKGHDKMLLNDLKLMNYKISDFPEITQTQALYQIQYYWIQHKSPISLLGYIMLLEGLAVTAGKEISSRVNNHKGKSFVKVHVDEDVDHLEKAFEVMNAFSIEEQEMITRNCEASSQLYINMLENMMCLKRLSFIDQTA